MAKKLFRTPRKPSLNRMLGISKAKSKFTRMTGGRAARDPKALVTNYKRRAKRFWGFERSSKNKGCFPWMILMIAMSGLIMYSLIQFVG
jgi:hypothetical protein